MSPPAGISEEVAAPCTTLVLGLTEQKTNYHCASHFDR